MVMIQCKHCGYRSRKENFPHRKDGSTYGLCRECKKAYEIEKSAEYRRRCGRPERVFFEYRISERGGVKGFECTRCKEWLPLSSYAKTARGQYKNICRPCHSEKNVMDDMLRRVREVFGEGSEEYRVVKDEERRDYRQALCVLLGVVANRKFQSPKELVPLRRILSDLSFDEGAFKDLLEKTTQEVQENAKRWRGRTDHTMFKVPEVQVRAGFL